MKQKNIIVILYAGAVMCAVSFCLLAWRDWRVYSAVLSSAPFRAFLLARAVQFLLPGLVFLLGAVLLQRKRK